MAVPQRAKDRIIMCVCVSCSVVSDSATPWTVAHQAPLSKGFSRQEYWNGLLCPPPGDLPNPGIKLRSPTLQADSLLSEPPRKLIDKVNKPVAYKYNKSSWSYDTTKMIPNGQRTNTECLLNCH